MVSAMRYYWRRRSHSKAVHNPDTKACHTGTQMGMGSLILGTPVAMEWPMLGNRDIVCLWLECTLPGI